jgi:hypothetical protein
MKMMKERMNGKKAKKRKKLKKKRVAIKGWVGGQKTQRWPGCCCCSFCALTWVMMRPDGSIQHIDHFGRSFAS